MNKISVIIADDHPLMRRGIRDVLATAEDISILSEVSNGADALACIREKRPNVAVLDVEMPGMSGLDVACAVRDAKLTTGIALLTMHKDEEFFNSAMNAGALGYILKENATDELLNCVRATARSEPFISPALSRILLNRARGGEQLRKSHPKLVALTPSERRILKLISEDKTTKEIAEINGISPRTVENHRANIAEKLELRGSHSLLKFAYDNKSHL
jgi:DNA-binding NarL/FixJ family response regulator